MPSKITELVLTAPDWATVDPLSAEVTAWLDRAYHAVQEVDPREAGVLRVHAEHLCDDTRKHSAEIVDTLHRVAWKMEKRERGW